MAGHFHSDRAVITAGQLVKLRSLMVGLLPANPFYRRKFSTLGKNIKFTSLADFSTQIPFTTKAEMVADQLRKPPYGTNLTFPLNHYVRFHQTSGTTGTPLRWLDTPESWQGMVESWKTIFRAAQVGQSDRVYFAFSFGPFIGFWLAYEAAQQLGCLCLPGGGLSSEARWRMILDNQATALCCTPTYALHLAEVAAKAKSDLHFCQVAKLLVAGEPGGSIPATRARLKKRWPTARIFDHHGMTEVGPVTYQCPKQPGLLHVMESAYFAEIVHPTSGQPVSPGETGELILTTLGRLGSPLLRYKTGDFVRSTVPRSQAPNAQPKILPCACGSYEMALAGGILGRVDDMVIVRGVNIYPSAVEAVLRGFREVVEYRVQLRASAALPELSLEIEVGEKCRAPQVLAEKVAKALQLAFHLRIPVAWVPAGTLPRFEMKAKRWLRV